MMKLRGDTLSCGLDPNATLRVLVRVTDPEKGEGADDVGPGGGFRVTILQRNCLPPSSLGGTKWLSVSPPPGAAARGRGGPGRRWLRRAGR